MDFSSWQQKYPEFKEVEITFDEDGKLQAEGSSKYCKCRRNEDCSEFPTVYEFNIYFTQPGKELGNIYQLNATISQKIDTSSEKVYFEYHEHRWSEESFDKTFFKDKESMHKIIKDLLQFTTTQMPDNFELSSAECLYPYPDSSSDDDDDDDD